MMQWVQRGVLGLFILGALLLLAFGPRPNLSDHRKDGRVVVHYWEKWGGTEAEPVAELIRKFNDTVGKEKGIFVSYLSVSGVNQKILVASAGQVPPDIAGMWEDDIPQFASLGALYDLTDMAADAGITKDYYKPIYWKACCYDGRLYGLVSTPWVTALHYNKQVILEEASKLRAAGLDPDVPPRTIDELDRWAEALTIYKLNPDGSRGKLIRAGYLPVNPNWLTTSLIYWFGGDYYDETNRKLLLDSPGVIATYDWIQSYAKKYNATMVDSFQSGFGQASTAMNPFLLGNIVMEMQGPWQVVYFEHTRPGVNRWKMSKADEKKLPRDERQINYSWGVVPFPSATGQKLVTLARCDVLCIPKDAKHPKEAFEFIKWLNRQDNMEQLCTGHGKNSPLRKVSAAFIENHPNPYIKTFEALASSPNAHTSPRLPIWKEVAREIDVAQVEIWKDGKDPTKVLGLAQKRMQKKVDRFFEIDDQRHKREQAE